VIHYRWRRDFYSVGLEHIPRSYYSFVFFFLIPSMLSFTSTSSFLTSINLCFSFLLYVLIICIYRIDHKYHPDKKFKYLRQISTEGTEISTSDRSLLKIYFPRDKATNHCYYLVRSTSMRNFHLLRTLQNPAKNIPIIIAFLFNKTKVTIDFEDFLVLSHGKFSKLIVIFVLLKGMRCGCGSLVYPHNHPPTPTPSRLRIIITW
jgi:hypothetical protein